MACQGMPKSLDGRGCGVRESREDELQHCNVSLEVIHWWIYTFCWKHFTAGMDCLYEVKSTVVQVLLGLELSEVHVTLTYV